MKNYTVIMPKEFYSNLSKAVDDFKVNPNNNNYRELVNEFNAFINKRRELTDGSNFPQEELERDEGVTIKLDNNDEKLIKEAQELIIGYPN